MSKVQTLRSLVNQRLTAAAAEVFGLIEPAIAEYEEELSVSRDEKQPQQRLLDAVFNPGVRIHRADVQQLLAIKAEAPPECLDPEDSEPLHMKEEEEDVHMKEEREALWNQREHKETEPPAGRSATPVKTETDAEDCGADDEMASASSETEVTYEDWQEPLSDSGLESEDGDTVWKETRAPESAAPGLKYKEALVSHVGCDTGNKPFSFFKCSKCFHHKGFLQKHMCHFGKMSYSCLVRKKCFTVKPKKDSQPRALTRERETSCGECGNRFTRLGSLKRHMSVHTGEKPFSCSECGNRFTRPGSLKQHISVHTGEKPFSCGECGNRFTRQAHLKRHMRIHTGVKSFSCDVCGMRFTQQGGLKQHMSVHTGEKPFSCGECGNRFTRHAHLKRHMSIHTGEKPFSCDVCGKRFAQQGGLKSHMRVHREQN